MTGSDRSWHEQEAWSGQASSEADQTLSDSDQTASDSDQTGSDGDQASARSDQLLSDLDQEAADVEFRSGPFSDPARLRAYEDALTRRGEGTLARAATGTIRARVASERDAQAVHRDENARRRDKTATARDTAAALADTRAAELAGSLGGLDDRTEVALAAAATAREKAATARVRAATDRRHAARDREAAALDRRHLQVELRRSQFDDLTGALRRGIGEVMLANEIDRASRDGGELQLAFIDVDGLKLTNDADGHAAGDSALRCVHIGFRSRLRPRDPIVRWGGDEFVCIVPGASAEDALGRMIGAQADLVRLDPQVLVTFGLATYVAGDSVTTLVERADAALLGARKRDS